MRQVDFRLGRRTKLLIKWISLYLFIGVMLLSFMFVYSFLRGKSSYAKVLGVLSLTLQVYHLGYLMEINASTLTEMIFWNQIQYLGIPFFPSLWLIISMLYTGKSKYLQGARSLLIFAVPVLTFIMRLTNDWHQLFYSRIELQYIGGAQIMLLTKGPWYLIQMGYVLLTLIACTGIYFQRYRKSSGDERIQFKLLLLASVLPYVSLVLIVLNIGGIGIDYTALILPPCVLLINLALTRYNFLDIKVLARERVFEDSSSGLILLNRHYRVVDFNAACVPFFQWFHTPLKEEKLDILLKDFPELMDCIREKGERVFQFENENETRDLNVNVKPVLNKDETIGYLVTMEDVTERERLRRQLLEMANTDVLSGLSNRRHFMERAEEAFQRALRYKEPLSALMLDIDFFKKINDIYGHHVGDAVIRNFSDMLSATFRGTDVVGRMGGEEFAVVMIQTDAETAFAKAERFRAAVESSCFCIQAQTLRMTISIGVSELGDNGASFDAVLNHADRCLYEAKHAGRNCVRVGFEGSFESIG